MHRSLASAFILLGLSGFAGAQMTLTLADGASTRGSFSGIAADGSWSWQGTGGPLTVPASKVVGLDAGEGTAPPLEDAFRIDLVTGDSIIGRIEDGSTDDLRLRNPAFGEVTFSLDDVAGIWNLALPRAQESLPAPQGKAETLYLDRDGRPDSFPGTLDKIGKNQLTFSGEGTSGIKNRVFSFARDRVIGVRFPASAKRPSKPSGSIIRLKDGSKLTATLRPSDGATLAIKLAGGPDMTIDSRHLRSIAIVNDSLRYLSDLDPASFAETPLMGGGLPQGLRRDAGLRSGQPLRIGRRTFTKGLMLPAKSRVVYRVESGFGRLVFVPGLDGGIEGGDLTPSVKISVLLDGKPLWTSGLLRAGAPQDTVEVGGLSGGKEVAIEVDFGDSYDAGARAVLGNAMLVK